MGKTLLILLIGFSASFTLMSISRNQRVVDSSDTLANQFSSYSASNASASGVYLALNRLYQDNTWRDGYSNLVLNGDSLTVVIEDNTINAAIPEGQIRILAISQNQTEYRTMDVMVFDGKFNGYAVWAKDSVLYVTTLDSTGNYAPDLLMPQAPYMPDIDQAQLTAEATNQDHIEYPNEKDRFEPADGYPNGNFYFSGTTPNVILVKGNLRIKANRTVYGIYMVEGHVRLDSNATIHGIVYLPDDSKYVYNSGTFSTSVYGGVVSWGKVFGNYGDISVQLVPEYMQQFVGNFVPNNPPLKVLSWK